MTGPSSAFDALPPALGNPGAPHRLVATIGGGPPRLTDFGERAAFHVAEGRGPVKKRLRRSGLLAARNILVVALDFIGDWVLTTPFLANLRRSAPRATITVVVLDRVFELARTCRFVDRVVAITRAERDRVWFGAATIGALAAFRSDFLGGAFDIALVPRWDVDFNGALKLAWASGAKHVVGFSERCTPRKAILNRGDDRFCSEAIRDRVHRHEAEHALVLLEAIGGAVTTRSAPLDLTGADVAAAAGFRAAAFPDRRPVLAVAPFVSDGRKQLPPERLAAAAKQLAATFDLDVAVIASPDDAADAERFAAVIGGERAASAAGLDLRVSAALIAEAVAFAGLDSGPAHIAGALGVPSAVIFPHPRDGSPAHVGSPERFRPWGNAARIRVIQPTTALSPCGDGCDADHPHCILQLDAETLWRELRDFIALFAARPAGQLPGGKGGRQR